jgi:hypothetical protein
MFNHFQLAFAKSSGDHSVNALNKESRLPVINIIVVPVSNDLGIIKLISTFVYS